MKKLLVYFSLVLPVAAQEVGQRTFTSPTEASKALVEVVASGDMPSLVNLVGKNAKAILTTGDPSEDAANLDAFLKACREKLQLVSINDSLTMLVVGKQNFPVPLPLVKKKSLWYFDGAIGLEEVRARRIGKNELSVIRACEAYTEAQRAYQAMNPDGSGIAQYADRFLSSAGKHDGLYWESKEGEKPSPLGPFLAEAGKTNADAGKAYHGYFYRILTSQGPTAPGGAYSYVINGHMVAGNAMVAYPASYGHTGIMTFLVGPNGAIYQKDLKDQGATVKTFEPGAGWKRL